MQAKLWLFEVLHVNFNGWLYQYGRRGYNVSLLQKLKAAYVKRLKMYFGFDKSYEVNLICPQNLDLRRSPLCFSM